MTNDFNRDLMIAMLRKGRTGDEMLNILNAIAPDNDVEAVAEDAETVEDVIVEDNELVTVWLRVGREYLIRGEGSVFRANSAVSLRGIWRCLHTYFVYFVLLSDVHFVVIAGSSLHRTRDTGGG